MFIDPYNVQDLHVPTEPGTLRRGVQIDSNGQFRVARRDAELCEVKILHGGSSGPLEIADGTGRPLFRMPSAFSGSFILGMHGKNGLILHQYSDIPASIVLCWREADTADI